MLGTEPSAKASQLCIGHIPQLCPSNNNLEAYIKCFDVFACMSSFNDEQESGIFITVLGNNVSTMMHNVLYPCDGSVLVWPAKDAEELKRRRRKMMKLCRGLLPSSIGPLTLDPVCWAAASCGCYWAHNYNAMVPHCYRHPPTQLPACHTCGNKCTVNYTLAFW